MASLFRLVAVVVLATAMVALMFDGQRDGRDVLSLSREGLLARAEVPATPFVPDRTTWAGTPHHRTDVILRTPEDVPTPAPSVEVVPRQLSWTWYEPPFDAVPHPVRGAAGDWLGELMEETASFGEEWRGGLEGVDPWRFCRLFGRAVLDSGVEVWVQAAGHPSQLYDAATVHLRDPASGHLAAAAIALEARWGSVEIDALPERVLQADLDGDGRVELIVEEQHHSGTDHWEHELEWYALDQRLEPELLLQSTANSYMGLMGWDGAMGVTVHRVHADELVLRGWYWPDEGETDPLGYSVLRRAGRSGPYGVAYEVIDPRGTRQRDVSWLDEPPVPGWHFAGYSLP